MACELLILVDNQHFSCLSVCLPQMIHSLSVVYYRLLLYLFVQLNY